MQKQEFVVLTRILSATALVAAVFAPATASAASDSGEFTLSVIVDKIIVLTVEDADIQITATDITGQATDTKGMTGSEARAEFSVNSNFAYDLKVTVPETWVHTDVHATYQQVKFAAAEGSAFIGGSIFLDEDMESPQNGNTGIVGWNGNTGEINATGYAAGVKRFGLGADFAPDVWHDGTSQQEGIAPEGVYSVVATVTATTQ